MTTWQGVIAPDPSLQKLEFVELHKHLDIALNSGNRANLSEFSGNSAEFDRYIRLNEKLPHGYEDQCSAKHYYDLMHAAINSKAARIVDIGVFTGGSSTVLAAAALKHGASLDLVDINDKYLLFTYERIRRVAPGAKVTLYRGDFPSYVKHVMTPNPSPSFIHHDGSHEFYQVVKDLASLYYVRQQVHSVLVQDTNLRGTNYRNFVDAAVAAVFGLDVKFEPLGMTAEATDPITIPNPYQGNYMLAGRPEAMLVHMAGATFLYPHSSMSIDELIAPHN